MRWIGCLLHLIVSCVSAQIVAPSNGSVATFYDQNNTLEIAVQRSLSPTTPFTTVLPLTNTAYSALPVSLSATCSLVLSIADYTCN